MGKCLTDFLTERSYFENILRAKFGYAFIDISNVKVPIFKKVICSKRLLIEFCQKGHVYS